ncbi:TIGR04211 family SH3 domain-containing protein [Saccharobesus litoralis]|nr:TIGR04211 family SH3 domain-containing protein [Saccharobesus litoralis]
MLRRILFTLSLLLVAFSASVQAENEDKPDGYVADDLFIYMHTGPSRNYRILGSITAGSPLKVLATNDENQFSQVEDEKGRQGWIENKFLSLQAGKSQQIEILNKQLTEQDKSLQATQSQLTNTNQKLASITQQTEQLSQQVNQLQNELQAKTESLNVLQNEKQNQAHKIQLEWLMKGGGVLLFGMIIGYMLPFLPKRKKRRDFGYGDL